jgi:DNA-binding NtrC family response regulator
LAAGSDTTQVSTDEGVGFYAATPLPGVLRAFAPAEATGDDRMAIPAAGMTVGRAPEADWTIEDGRMSKLHVRFGLEGGEIVVEDLGSTNGTFVNGEALRAARRRVTGGDLVRCGQSLLVVCPNLRPLWVGGHRASDEALVGRFYAPVILGRLAEAATVGRHVLLCGESGVGKELGAQALGRLARARSGLKGELVAHNCARFATEEEATATIFGVKEGVFSSVAARAGLLEQASDGVLFLDEVHALPLRVQRSLLRFAEDQVFSRIGETAARKLRVLLVAGTNVVVEDAIAQGLLAFDLVNRLQRVELPALGERRADIPDILVRQLELAAVRHAEDATMLCSALHPDYLEAICLVAFEQRNVRELMHLAEALAARVALGGEPPATALGQLLAERYPGNPVIRRSLGKPAAAPGEARGGWSHYEQHREAIVEAYHRSGRNLSATVRLLEQQGIRASRRWLSDYLERWGIR